MKKFHLSLALLLLAFSSLAGQPKARFIYNVGFEYLFDNTEYDASKGYYENSSTLHALRLSPGVGVRIEQDGGRLTHRLFAGLNIMKNFGSALEAGALINDFEAWYRLDANLGKGRLGAVAGCYPRAFSEGYYPETFFSLRKRRLDIIMEGMLFNYRTDRLYAELALDWMGLKGPDSRERFQILSAGEYIFPYGISAGWAASFFHFACSQTLDNVVDNHMVFAYAKWNPLALFPCLDMFQKMEVNLGPVVSYQRDRAAEGSTVFPWGILTEQELRLYNAGIANSFYFGEDLQPYYSVSYKDVMYGSDLYFGNRFYHTHIKGFSFYDRLEAYYEPHITPWLDLRVSLFIHLGNPTRYYPVFRGWEQTFMLKFNLDRLLK